MAPQELDKVLSIESFADVTKRNGDDNELDSLKIMPLKGMKEKKRTIHWASCTRVSQLKRNPSQNYAGCTFKFLLQRQWKVSASTTRKKDLPSLIQATRIELLYLKQTIFVLTSKPLVSLSCSDEFSSHDIVLRTKWDVKAFPVPLFL